MEKKAYILNKIFELYPESVKSRLELEKAVERILEMYSTRKFDKHRSILTGRLVVGARTLRGKVQDRVFYNFGNIMECYIPIYKDWLSFVSIITDAIISNDKKKNGC